MTWLFFQDEMREEVDFVGKDERWALIETEKNSEIKTESETRTDYNIIIFQYNTLSLCNMIQ